MYYDNVLNGKYFQRDAEIKMNNLSETFDSYRGSGVGKREHGQN